MFTGGILTSNSNIYILMLKIKLHAIKKQWIKYVVFDGMIKNVEKANLIKMA
jgi:hypothetical protein